MIPKLLLTVLSLIILIGVNLGFQIWGRSLPTPSGESWIVERVLSGQSVAVKSNDGATKRIRLQGIIAPAKEQEPWGNLAKLRLEQLVKDQTIILEPQIVDSDSAKFAQNLTRGYIWQGNTLINAQLVKEGYVWADSDRLPRKYDTKLEMLQSEARILELGIWNPQNPLRIHPQDFRRQLLRSASLP